MPGAAAIVDMNGSEPDVYGTVNIIKGGPAVLLGAAATIVDPDSFNFAGGFLSAYVTGSQEGDQLVIASQGNGFGQIGVSGSAVSYGGVQIGSIRPQPTTTPSGFPLAPTYGQILVDLNGNATPEALQALLQRMAYSIGANSYVNGSRFASVQLRDGDFINSGAGTTIEVTSVNVAPTVVTSTAMMWFTEAAANGTPVPVTVDPHIDVNDPDSGLVSATIRITGGFVAGQDLLDLPSAAFFGLTASYDAAAGTLQLTANGSGVATNWRQALSSVRYVNIADEPTGGNRTISFTVNDGIASSAPATKTMLVVLTTDPTVLDLNGPASFAYTEQAPAARIAPGATVTDVDTPNFAGGRLTVGITFTSSQMQGAVADVIGILNGGTGAGQIGVAGTQVTYGGVAIGSVSGGTGMTPLVVSLNAAAETAAVQALVRAVSYSNGSDRPSPILFLTVKITEASGASAAAEVRIEIAQVDDPTTFDLNGAAVGENGVVSYTPGNPPVAIAPDARFADVDTFYVAGGSVRLRVLGAQPGDAIGIQNQGEGPGQISVYEDNSVAYEGSRIGIVYPASGQVVFDTQYVPLAAVQALVRAAYFANLDPSASTATRTLQIEVRMQGGEVMSRTVTVDFGRPLTLVGDEAANMLFGGSGDDSLSGLGGDDQLTGGAGNDLLDGGGGADRMTGGAGNDSYQVTDAGDIVIEAAGEGTDKVVSTVDFALPDNVEQLTLVGSGNLRGIGNALDNLLVAGSGANRLEGGGGSDGFFFGGTFDAADSVDGGAGVNDQIGLQGNYAGLALGANSLVDVETLVLLSGADTRFGGGGAARFSYDLRTADANIAAGKLLTVNMNMLLAGENATFDGSAESDGLILTFGGRGDDKLTGGSQSDGFYFGTERLGLGDRIVGGAGADDQVGLQGDIRLTFGEGQLAGIESIVVLSATDTRFGGAGAATGARYSYDLILVDGNADGARLTVTGAQLVRGETLAVDGSAETDAALRVFGGAGADRLIGGALADEILGGGGDDVLTGGRGADRLAGGEGADRFVYGSEANSTGAGYDTINGFDFAVDRLDLAGARSDYHRDADAGGSLSSATFDGDLVALLNGVLTSGGISLVTANAGSLSGQTFLVADANGVAGYQADQDLVIALAGSANLPALGVDFIV